MAAEPRPEDDPWIAAWLDAVAAAGTAMSQRSLRTIEAHGGLERAVAAARRRGLHLLQVTDERGRVVVAASRHPVRTLC